MQMVMMCEFGAFMFKQSASCKTTTNGECRLGRIMTCKLSDFSEETTGLLLLLLLRLDGRSLGWRICGRGCWSLWCARVFPLGDAGGGVEVEPEDKMLERVLTGTSS
jgi:hypothetical protein